MIYNRLAEARNWPPDVVNGLTMRQVRLYCMTKEEVDQIGLIPKTKVGRKSTVDKAIANLMAGKRWDAR